MNLPRYARVMLAIGSGAALGLSFPNYNLYLLAWIAMGMLVLTSSGAPIKEAPLYGFLHGQVFYPVCLPWVDTVIQQYGNIDPWIAAAFVGMIGFIGGLVCTMFSTGVALASKKSRLLACLVAPFLWTALEFFRTNVPIIGSSWDLSGYPAARSLALVQLTSVTGIYGLCFLIAAFGSLLAYAVLVATRRAWGTTVVVTILLIFAAAVGPRLIPSATPRYIAHLVQTNFPQSEGYPPDWLQVNAGELDQLERISVDAAKQIPGIIIWPEVPAPFTFQEIPFAQCAERIARDSGNYFLVGVLDSKQDAAGKWLAFNSAVLLNPAGQRVFGYDKIHLLPFGEYVPLRGWLFHDQSNDPTGTFRWLRGLDLNQCECLPPARFVSAAHGAPQDALLPCHRNGFGRADVHPVSPLHHCCTQTIRTRLQPCKSSNAGSRFVAIRRSPKFAITARCSEFSLHANGAFFIPKK